MQRIKKLVPFVLIFLIILFGFSVIRNYTKLREADRIIEEEGFEVERLKEEQEELSNKLENVESAVFIEKQLRDDLGLAKEEETVIVLPDPEVLRTLAPKRVQVEEIEQMPNWEKWRRLFF